MALYVKLFFASAALICGGSIISTILVLTAAHCILSSKSRRVFHFQVIAGVHNISFLNASEQVRDVKLIYTHENYDNSTFMNDIAILLLSEPLRYTTTIRNLNLPRKGETFQGNATISGWGKTEVGGWGSIKLRKVSAPIVPLEDCRSRYRYFYSITDAMICIGGTGADSCGGDSGGAAVCTRPDSTLVQCGIVSFGIGCGRKEYPGVYTLVTAFIDWIKRAEKQILFMECTINHWVMDHEKAKPLEYEMLKNTSYEILQENLSVMHSLITYVKAGSDTIQYIGTHKESIRTLTHVSKKLGAEIRDLNLNAVTLCAQEMSSYSKTSAEKAITTVLGDRLEFRNFMNKIYTNYGNIHSLKYLMSFTEQLPTCMHEKLAVIDLLEVAKLQRHTHTLEMLLFQDALQICGKVVQNLKIEISNLVNSVVDHWGQYIRIGISQEVYEFALAYPTEFRKQLARIIEFSYRSKRGNFYFEGVFEFIRGIPLISDQSFAMHILFDVMKEYNEFDNGVLMLGYRAHQLNFDNEWKEEKHILESIKESLPTSVKLLLVDNNFRLVRKEDIRTLYLIGKYDNATKTVSATCCDVSVVNQNDVWGANITENGRYAMLYNWIMGTKYYLVEDNQEIKLVSDQHVLNNKSHWQILPVYNATNFYFVNRNSGSFLTTSLEVGDPCRHERNILR